MNKGTSVELLVIGIILSSWGVAASDTFGMFSSSKSN